MVEDQFVKVGRVSRGQLQRQVGIWVLQATAMPSILVETGYITNRSEEDYLNSKEGQEEIALCISNALKNYISWLEKQQTSSPQTNILPQKIQSKQAYNFLNAIETEERKRKTR
jgi:N-acetylmuramoyl-L-alanine amidase